jgi:hypothetical protein
MFTQCAAWQLDVDRAPRTQCRRRNQLSRRGSILGYPRLLIRKSQPLQKERSCAFTSLAVAKPDATIVAGNECDVSVGLVPVFLSSDQRLSDCEDDSAEEAAINQVAQSISCFGQREDLSHDRFDRAGLKQRGDSAQGVNPRAAERTLKLWMLARFPDHDNGKLHASAVEVTSNTYRRALSLLSAWRRRPRSGLKPTTNVGL